MLTLKTAPTQNVQPQPHKKYCVNAHGFSLHASVRCAMNQRKELEHLCRYITRPAIANERLTRNAAGQVVLALKTPYRDGTTHIAMPPLEFMQQLAALVLRPRLNLICSNGVLAPNAKLRAEIIPGEKKGKSTPSDANDNAPHSAATKRISWARLLRRVFNINIEQSQLSVHLKLMGKAVYFSYTHLVLASTLTLASTAAAQTDPLLSGTFVQLNPQLIGLGPDGWRAELAHMRAIGMDTLIVQYSRYGDVAYFPTGEATDAGNVLPPNESVATLVWQAPVGAAARHLRVTVTPDSREWTMIPEVRVLSGGQNAAAGLGYALAPAPASNYLDPNAASGGKLTDGFANFAWSDMVGWQRLGENIIIDFDLGDVTALEAVEVDFMRSDVFNVDLPASISVSVSGDGGNFLPLGRPVTWGEEASSPDRSTWNPLSDLIGAAEEFGFEVWLGLSLDPAYWQGSFDPEASSTANIALMHTLEKLYGSSPAVVGYYLPEEIDDRSFVSESAHAAMTQYLAAMADAAHMIGRLVMVAPYFGMNPDGEAYAAWWDTTLQAADIDVITMQDGVGTRRTTVAQGVPVFRALKEVADRHGVAFWSDLEVFEQTHGWPVDDLVWQAQPATIESVIEQLELEAPFVEKFVVFDFTHYMSPRLGGASAELYDAYADYLEAYREKGSR